MNKKILLATITTIFLLASCSSGREESIELIDPYISFKADVTPRWENGATVEKNDGSPFTFFTDNGENLFSSTKYKIGRISDDYTNYEIIEFSGKAAVGKPNEPIIRKPSGATPLHSLEIVQEKDGTLWLVFKETATSPERRIVQ